MPQITSQDESPLSNEGRVRLTAALTRTWCQAFFGQPLHKQDITEAKDWAATCSASREFICRSLNAVLLDYSSIPDCISLVSFNVQADDIQTGSFAAINISDTGELARALTTGRHFSFLFTSYLRFVQVLTSVEIKSLCRGLLHAALFEIHSVLADINTSPQDFDEFIASEYMILTALMVHDPRSCHEVFLAETMPASNRPDERRTLLEVITAFISRNIGFLNIPPDHLEIVDDLLLLSDMPFKMRYLPASTIQGRAQRSHDLQERLFKARITFSCSYCGKIPENDLSLKRCGGCRLTFYCDTTCSAKDWSKGNPAWDRTTPHKEVCHKRALKIKSSS